MPRYYAGSTVPFRVEVRNNGILTDAAAISFKWKIGLFGAETTVAPTHASTGVYTVSVTPLTGGNLYGRWDTDGVLDIAAEPVINIAESAFVL